MSGITLSIAGDPPLVPRRLRAVERLGEASTFELDLDGPEDSPVTPADVLRKPARLTFDTQAGGRSAAGLVTRFTVIAGDHAHRRAYRITIQSTFALLALRTPARTFQELTAPEIVEQVARAGGYAEVTRKLSGSYPKLRYVVQYQESDAAFARRICEEHGLYFRFEAGDEGEVFVLEDDSTRADDAYPDAIACVSRGTGSEPAPIAVNLARRRKRAAGKVTLRDYDPDKPDLALQGESKGGLGLEQALEVYEAPGGFHTPDEGATRAKIRLESLRAEAARLSFDTNALALAPGKSCALSDAPDEQHAVRSSGEQVVIAMETRWDGQGAALRAKVESLPREVPFRLSRITPRPRIAGIQSAWVTGEKGAEIHPDPLGRVHLRFHWDLQGEGDHRSSLPVRVAQSQLAGPMIVPRVGWEVFVIFEDGDPNRPLVLGRSYNQKQPPPLPLPANKTVTSIATDSSPGAGARTVIQMDDAAGREHMLFNAPFGDTKTVAGKHSVQTQKNENLEVTTLNETVGATEAISVHLGYLGGYGSRTIGVGAAQYQSAGGNFASMVGSEVDVVGGLQLEQVGNPVKGAANLAVSAALSYAGGKGKLGMAAAAVAGAARAAAEGYDKGGLEGAAKAAAMSGVGTVAGFVPGGEAILAEVTGSSKPMPWDHGRPDSGEAAPGGGASGAGGADGGATGPGPGHRNVLTSATYSELVGGLYAVMTPGAVSWVTAGMSNTLIRGSHTTVAPRAGIRVLGGLGEWLGALVINSGGFLARTVTGVMRSSTDGALALNAAGDYALSGKAMLTLKVDGSLTLNGATVTFKCGGAEIVASPGSVLLSAPSITLNGSSSQSGSLTHS